MTPRRRSHRHPLTWPLIIGALMLAGLVIGLAGDGWHDAAAWAALSIPLFAIAYSFRKDVK